jgi:hypothetical protein
VCFVGVLCELGVCRLLSQQSGLLLCVFEEVVYICVWLGFVHAVNK